MMGACFECVAIVDGNPGVQTCMTPVHDGMRIERQDGAHNLSDIG
jgi:NADH dehydrogenase/NADH:ubiquinone oxidoreductase subunit G